MGTSNAFGECMTQYVAERIVANENIDAEEEFSGFYMSHEKAAVSELIEPAKSENALYGEKMT